MIKIKNYSDRAEICLWGDIITDTDANWLERDRTKAYQFPAKIKEQLDELKGVPLDVHIASDGGDCAAGIAIYNMLANHDAPVTVYIDSWAASIASYVAFAGQKIVMPENTFLMIHNPKAGAWGDASYLRTVADWLEKLRDNIAGLYSKKATDKPVDDFNRLMDAETWLTAAECKALWPDVVELREATEIEAVASLKTSFIKKAPAALMEKYKAHENGNNEVKNKILSVLREAYKYEEKS